MLNQSDLEYPVILIGRNYFSIFLESSRIIKSSVSALENGIYNDAIFIDSSGTQFETISVRKVGYVPPFLGFRLLRKRQIFVSFQFSKIDVISFEEVIKLVKTAAKKSHWGAHPDFLRETASSSKSIKEFFLKFNK
jgi:hypothetical protein